MSVCTDTWGEVKKEHVYLLMLSFQHTSSRRLVKFLNDLHAFDESKHAVIHMLWSREYSSEFWDMYI